MGRLAYLDCFSGVSGDMLLGAIIDCGVSVGDLRGELAKLRLDGYNLSATRVTRSGLAATQAVVEVAGAPAPRTLGDVHEVFASPLPAGAGAVDGPHGKLPVPAPATLELLSRANAPLRPADGASGELVTPTGAAILTTVARFERPAMTLERAGYGAGSREIEGRPNVLRIWLGERIERGVRQMVLIETNIDDMTGEMLGYARDTLLDAGAADVWFTSVQMKKGRPGVMLSVVGSEEQEEAVARLLLRETSTLGVRVRPVHRWEAARELLEFESSLGPASVKVKRLAGEPPTIAPEYEACKRLAEATGLALAEVYRIVQAEWVS